MKAIFTVAKIYPVKTGENLKGAWKSLDAVLRNDEEVIYEDGGKANVMELMAIRLRGIKADQFLNEVKAGMRIEATIRPNCEEKVSRDGATYAANDFVFSCPEWRVI